MRTIIILKTSEPDKRIVLRTDSLYNEYESMFTVMTVEGAIEGVMNPYKGGSVICLSDISRFIANNTGIEAVVLSPDNLKLDVAEATPKFLSIDVYGIINETTYRERISMNPSSYNEQKDSLPWIAIQSVKAILDTPFDLEISHNGSPCTFGGKSSDFGTVSGTKISISDFQNVVFECKRDLGATDPKGVWLLKFTMSGIVDLREIVIP